ncbi:MAG TPA: sulfur carrier protein ThiS [Rectinemataceae bacterium]|nr:sulfur carrier protein ThiS [Rectinemataceae bacterium]
MTVTVNGETRTLPDGGATVRSLLDALRYSFPLLIVRVNGTLVERSQYANQAVGEGDTVDVYHLVSGG